MSESTNQQLNRSTQMDWCWCVLGCGILMTAYLLMLNPYWVPSGDGEVYTAMARSLARGEGLLFNGARAAIAPPGWPILLAGAMRLLPEFWFLKLINILAMTAGLGMSFWIARRFVGARLACLCMLLAGTLSTLYPLTYWMHTEASFIFVASLAILMAFRIGEGRALRIEWILMLICLAWASFIRWPGALTVLLVTAGLLRPGVRLLSRRSFIGVAIAWTVAFGTFAATHQFLSLSKDEARLARAAGGTGESETGTDVATVDSTVPAITDDQRTPTIFPPPTEKSLVGEYASRVASSGKWFAWVLWQPTRFGESVRPIRVAGLMFGTFVIALLVWTLVNALRRREWFWLALAAYTGGLVLMWPNPNARYYVPVVIFIIAGIFNALRLMQLIGWRRLSSGLTYAFIIATLGSNLPLYAYEVWVFRSGDRFYDRYEAGSNASLIASIQWIEKRNQTIGTPVRMIESPIDPSEIVSPGRIAVSERYMNMGRTRFSKYGVRASHLLSDQSVLGVDRNNRISRRPTEDATRRWAIRNGVSYYLYQVPTEPWRVGNFRLTPSLQKAITGREPEGDTMGWELYERMDGSSRYRLVTDLPEIDLQRMRRVPGL
jgi:hypothetical protein